MLRYLSQIPGTLDHDKPPNVTSIQPVYTYRRYYDSTICILMLILGAFMAEHTPQVEHVPLFATVHAKEKEHFLMKCKNNLKVAHMAAITVHPLHVAR